VASRPRVPARPWPLRILRGIARTIGVLVAVIVALVAAAIVAVNLRWGRRLAVRELNTALSPMFKGHIVVEDVGHLGLDGASGVDAHVTATDGTLVLAAHGASARIAPFALLRSFLRRQGDLRITFVSIEVRTLEVNIDTDGAGVLKVQSAFDPAQPTPTNAAPPRRPLRLDLPSVTLRHGWVHGHMKGAPPLDADLDELHASILVPPKGVQIDVPRVNLSTRGMPEGADAHARIEAHLAMPSQAGADLGASGALDGNIGGIPTTAHASLDGDRLEAVLDVPEVSADRVRALVPSLELQRPARAHVEAQGTLRTLAVTAHLGAGASTVDASGDVAVTGLQSVTMRIDARHVDLSAFSPAAPASDLTASLDLRARTDAEGLFSGDYAVAIAPGLVARQSVPNATLAGDFQQTRQTIHVDAASSVVAFPRDLGVGGHAAIQASATIALMGPTSLEATARVAIEGLDGTGFHADAAELDARASGTMADPQLSATLAATDVHAGGYAFRRVLAEIAGKPSRATFSASLLGDPGSVSAQARAIVDVAGSLRIEDAEVDLQRGPRALRAHVDRVAAGAGAVDVEGARIEGVGSPTRATVHMRPASLVVQSDSNGIDLGTLGYLLGSEKILRKGRVSYVVDVTARANGLFGTAVVDMDNACFLQVDGLTGHIDTRMHGRGLRGAVQLRADGVGSIHADPVNVELAGNEPLQQASWRRASGDVTLNGDLDLAKLIDLLPPNSTPLAGASGKLTLAGHVTRKAGSDAIPDVTLSVKTSGLRFETRTAPDGAKGRTVLVAAPKAAESGIDVALQLEADGTANTGKIAVSLVDAHGTLIAATATSRAIPYAELASAPATIAERMLRVPFSARVAMPARSLDQLPDMLRLDGASGMADLTVSVEGTGVDPRVTMQGGMHSVRLTRGRKTAPIEAELTGKYDGAVADAAVHVTSATSTAAKDDLLDATAHANARIRDIVERGAAAWDASAHAKLKDFPLAMIPPLADRRVHGTANGEIDLTGLHRDARAKLDLDVTDLRVGQQKYGKMRLATGYDGHALDADLHFDQGAGVADAKAKVALTWGAQLTPSPDPSGSTHASLTAKKFRFGFVAPFLQSAADALDGSLDADAHVNLDPGQKPEMSGTVSLSDGVVGLASLGQELHAVTANVVLTPDGVVRLQDASASATAGKATAVGVARLDGTSLVGAEVDLQILKRDAMPLDVEGSDLGSIYGKFVVKMSTSADRRATIVSVDVPSLNVHLPDASTHSVEDLGDPPEHDHIGTYAAPGRFVSLPMDGHQARAEDEAAPGSPLTVNVHIGDAQIARGTDVRVDLTGTLSAKVEKKTTMTGQITIRRGKLDVQGKSFDIEPGGTATFTSDPANPEIKVTAGWTAEDGTRVLADYVGPLKTGKVTLRSDPARPQNEIVALIAFGSADGSEATPYAAPPSDPTMQAGTTVGGFATAGLSRGLDKLTGLDITAKIDTSQPNPRPEVEVQIARNISLELSVVLGTPPPGTNEDTTYATVDWRFHKHWSLETTFGNVGSSIADVIWRRRY
jgi:translocation and assembly module TamB